MSKGSKVIKVPHTNLTIDEKPLFLQINPKNSNHKSQIALFTWGFTNVEKLVAKLIKTNSACSVDVDAYFPISQSNHT